MHLIKWFFFLSKRLYKKWMFLVLIALIPLSVLALKLASAQKAGFANIAVVNPGSEICDAIVENLSDGANILSFTEYRDEQSAVRDLSAGRLDAVWVLPEQIEQRISDYVNDPKGEHYLVKVIKTEDSLKTRLALEKLSAAIFPYTSRLFFVKCVRDDPELALSALTDEQILSYYDAYFSEGALFTFAFPDGTAAPAEAERSYLTSPVRGLLSAVVLLAGLSAAMLYADDEKKGVFSFAKSENRVLIAFANQLTAVANIGLFVFVSLFLLGVAVGFWRELANFAILLVNTALFCCILQQLMPRLLVFAPAAALIAVLDIMICPIFFDFYVQKTPQYFLPNAYYLNAVHSDLYLRYSLVFTAAAAFVLGLFYLKKRRA